jgi:hypothetical protein
LVKQGTHWFAGEQYGAAPPHTVSSTHSTHVCFTGSQVKLRPQFAAPRHSTQCRLATSQ